MANSENKCLQCNRTFDKESGLHLHIAKSHYKLNDYYHKYFPRYDKYDGSLIYFKDKDFYFSADFNDRHNQKAWLRDAPADIVKAYLRTYFEKRKIAKEMTHAPSQIELRSLNLPGKKYLNELFGNYTEFFDSLGLPSRFSQETLSALRDLSKQKIIIDTREQTPLEFGNKTKREALKFGDYRLSNDSVSQDCYVERKSIMDFHGTLGRDFDRFTREIIRASDARAYLVVIVEGTLEDLHKFANDYPAFNKPSSESRRKEYTITSPQFVLRNMRKLLHQFENLQFLFVHDRPISARVIERLFASEGEYKKCDLQFAYDMGNLT